MSDILVVTNRKLCEESLAERVEKLAKASPAGIILREKDLTEKDYEELASRIIGICRENKVMCILHSFYRVAAGLGCRALHMPLSGLREMPEDVRRSFDVLGASCHSVKDAEEAVSLGCTYITAGHIFDTDSKKGRPGRGIDFLSEICSAVSLPVYAIGGIMHDNIDLIRAAGAEGACVMSGAMTCDDAESYIAGFQYSSSN